MECVTLALRCNFMCNFLLALEKIHGENVERLLVFTGGYSFLPFAQIV